MYSLIYELFFILKRYEWKSKVEGKKCPHLLRRTIDYIEWFYNVPVANWFKKHPSSKNGLNRKRRKKKVIVSLTTFPKRIGTVWLTVETLLRQKTKPDEVILWLAKTQFDGLDSLPDELLMLQKRGLTIRFCDDLRSHKKYYYTMKEHPEDLVILADDDMFYPYDFVEKLLKLHKDNPNDIVCFMAQMVNDFTTLPSTWNRPHINAKVMHSSYAQPFTGAGTLFPPHRLDDKFLFNKDLFMKICPYADDLWLKYMSLRKKTKVTLLYKWRSIPVEIYGSSTVGLWYINGQDGQNDVQWKALLDYFGTDGFPECDS